jgi:hypothetical protein
MLIRTLSFLNIRSRFLFDPEPQGGTGTTTPAPTTPTGGAAQNGDDKKFTQADVDRIVGERAARAGEAATAKLLESLGVKTPDEIKAALEKIQTLEDAQKSELEKAQGEAAKYKAQAEKAKSDADAALEKANEKLLQSAVLLEAQKQNADDAEFLSVWRELKETPTLREKLKQNDAGDFEGVADAVKEILKLHPKWLKAAKPPTPGTPRPAQTQAANAQTGTQQQPAFRRGDF